jgi:Flp pilus assembly protein TadG
MKLMKPTRLQRREGEQGITILLVAVCMAFIVMAFAALAVDVTTLYTARTEARMAADAGALAGAKVLSVSGMTSDPTNTTLPAAAVTLATQVATATATSNMVGGRQLVASEVTVSIPTTAASFTVNPQVTVTVRRTDLPAFFSKIWGTQFLSVSGTAIAEAYNPSGAGSIGGGGAAAPPISPQCVKPWILPNINPFTSTQQHIFDPTTGAINAGPPSMIGQVVSLKRSCATNGCNIGMSAPVAGSFYDANLAPPNAGTLPSSCTLACTYEENIAACSPAPIACNTPANVALEMSGSCSNYNSGTLTAASCLIHNTLGEDTITVNGSPLQTAPQFFAGGGNPLVANGIVASGDQVTTSNSIVTIPVYDGDWTSPVPTSPVAVIGFL